MKIIKKLLLMTLTIIIFSTNLGITNVIAAADPSTIWDNYFVYDDGKNTINGTDNFSKHGFFLLNTNSTTDEHFMLAQRSYELAPLDDANTNDDGTIYKLDPNSSTNLAYKMNTGTLLTGNKRKVNDVSYGVTLKTPTYSNFPKSVFDPLVNVHTWTTEKSGPVTAAYTIDARYSILSKTEYETYIIAGETDATKKLARVSNYLKQNELSAPVAPASLGQKGQLLLRTASANKAYMYGVLMNVGNTNTLAHDWACLFRYNTEQQIKPVFYTKSDFFKTVKLEVGTMGKNIKRILFTKYTRSELANIGYNDSELIALGFERETSVSADNYFQYTDGGSNNNKHGFYLLDSTNDNQSKFFVISERSYATAPLDDTGASLIFDPTIPSNVAYKMNSGNLLTDGTTGNPYWVAPATYANFPAAVSNYADPNHVWPIEKSEVNQDATFASTYISEPYQVTAKFALLSKTEYNKYYKNGTGFNIKANVMQIATDGKYEVLFRSSYGPYFGCYMQGYKTRLDKDVFSASSCSTNSASNPHQIKPVLYLGRNFFPSVKLDVNTMGKNVKNALLNTYTKAEMQSAGYTSAELAKIGFGDYTLIAKKGAVTAGATEIFSSAIIKNHTVTSLINPTLFAVLYDANQVLRDVSIVTTNITIAAGGTSNPQEVVLPNLSQVTADCMLKILGVTDLNLLKPIPTVK